jgi:hypothetical protein
MCAFCHNLFISSFKMKTHLRTAGIVSGVHFEVLVLIAQVQFQVQVVVLDFEMLVQRPF